MDRNEAEALGRQSSGDLSLAENAVWLGAAAERVRDVAVRAFERRRARQPRKVEHHTPAADAAQLGHTAGPVWRVHNHSETHGGIEAAIREWQLMRVAVEKRDVGVTGACARNREHLL